MRFFGKLGSNIIFNIGSINFIYFASELFQKLASHFIVTNNRTDRQDRQIGQGQIGQGQKGQGQIGQGQIGQGQIGQGQIGEGQIGQGQIGHGQIGQGQIGQDQIGQGQIGQIRQIGQMDRWIDRME